MSTTNQPRYDLTQLTDMYGGNMENVKKTVAIFCDQLEKDAIMVKEKFDENDLPSVKSFAHRMKPNLKLFGVMDMHELILKIEESSLAGDREKLGPQLEDLLTMASEVMQDMKKEI
ncbi:MAG: Hpt domain-containing protein [Flavobacteriales bacterium]